MNFLVSFADFFAKGGPLMWPILLCSVLALAIVLFKTLEYTTALHTLGKIKRGDSIPPPWFLAPICERLGTADEETLSLTATSNPAAVVIRASHIPPASTEGSTRDPCSPIA